MASSLCSSGFEALKCAICLEDMTDRKPRALNCLHTFCEGCLGKLPKDHPKYIQCPTCREYTELSSHGITGLIFFLMTLGAN